MTRSFGFFSSDGIRNRGFMLEDAWPSSFRALVSSQSQESGMISSSTVCVAFLTLLGKCTIIENDPSRQHSLVIRCSACDLPFVGMQQIEMHLRCVHTGCSVTIPPRTSRLLTEMSCSLREIYLKKLCLTFYLPLLAERISIRHGINVAAVRWHAMLLRIRRITEPTVTRTWTRTPSRRNPQKKFKILPAYDLILSERSHIFPSVG